MNDREEDHKPGLSIRLIEPVVYLKDVDFSGKGRTHNELSPPSMIRGVLVLRLKKPRRIRSIGIELKAVSLIRLPQGELSYSYPTEERQLYSSSTVYFDQEAAGSHTRRSPSIDTEWEDDDFSFDLGLDHHERRGTSHTQRRTHVPISSRRGESLDFHRDVVRHHTASPASSPDDIPSADSASDEGSVSFAIQSTPPLDQGSPPRPTPLQHTQSNPRHAQHDCRTTIPGARNLSTPPSVSRRSPTEALEGYRRALSSDMNVSTTRLTPPHAETHTRAQSTIGPSPRGSHNETPTILPPSSTPVESNDDYHRGRKSRNRFSLSAISDTFRESVRSHSVSTNEGRPEEIPTGPRSRDNSEKGRRRSPNKRHSFSRELSHRVAKVFGYEPERGREHQLGWKFFMEGTYQYPISFSIPANSPPSLEDLHGSVVWTLTATVHRPGMLAPRMKTVLTINVVATPSEDTTEDNESLVVQRSWGERMNYCLSLTGRAFPIGGRIPIQLTILPLSNIKIFKVSIAIVERPGYCLEKEKWVSKKDGKVHSIRSLKYTGYTLTPILPLVDDIEKSPLHAIVKEDLQHEERKLCASELITEWRGSGPWPLTFNEEIPNVPGGLHPTNMNKKGNIVIPHSLKVTIRVGYETVDEHGEKWSMSDIILETPIHLLSHLCNQEYTSLPEYPPIRHPSPSPSGQPPSFEAGFPNTVPEVPATDLEPAKMDPAQRAAIKEREQLTHLFERLIAGQETETGESPPPYEAAAPSVRAHNPHP